MQDANKIKTRTLAADEHGIATAAESIRRGGLVAFPTETVYGLGANACDDIAVARIFEAKGRPSFNPLIVHFASVDAVCKEVEFDNTARHVAQAFWPGPLTLVLPRRAESQISRLCSAGMDSLAVRLPRHPVSQSLIKLAGCPLAAPSANLSGRTSPTTAEHVADMLDGRIEVILDAGPAEVGLESSVLDLTGETPRLLRQGGVTQEEIQDCLTSAGLPVVNLPASDVVPGDTSDGLRSPGLLTSHYAPRLPLRLDAAEVFPGEALLAFGPNVPKGAAAVWNLSASGDLREAAARLFAGLHSLDRPEFSAIAAMTIPEKGLGKAINDRLRRAAAQRNPA